MLGAVTTVAICFLSATTPGFTAEEKSQAEKAAADWLYPKATVTNASHVGDLSCVVHETPDDVAAVVKHYGTKLGIDLPEKGSTAASGGGPGKPDVEYVSGGSPAGHLSTFKTKAAVATVLIHRPPNGKVTTIVVTHVALAQKK